MARLSWFFYGVGVLVLLVLLMQGSVDITDKTLVIAAALFTGAIIAAIQSIPVRDSRVVASRAPTLPAAADASKSSPRR
jgi:hypothetical protein